MKKKTFTFNFEGMVCGSKYSAAMIHLTTNRVDQSFMVPLETGEDYITGIAKLAAHGVYLYDDGIPNLKPLYKYYMKRISAEIREDLEKLGDLTQYVIEDPIDRKICEKFASH
jgi:hypothetical protein